MDSFTFPRRVSWNEICVILEVLKLKECPAAENEDLVELV